MNWYIVKKTTDAYVTLFTEEEGEGKGDYTLIWGIASKYIGFDNFYSYDIKKKWKTSL